MNASTKRQTIRQPQAPSPPVQHHRLHVSNRQRKRAMDVRLVKGVLRRLLGELLDVREADLGLYLVGTKEMTRLNESFLHHAGCTDVIAFDYLGEARRRAASARRLHGEILVCVDEAIAQAHRFRTTWRSEIMRYIVHGVLHLQGYTDTRPTARRRMKAVEDRLVRRLAQEFEPRSAGRSAGA